MNFLCILDATAYFWRLNFQMPSRKLRTALPYPPQTISAAPNGVGQDSQSFEERPTRNGADINDCLDHARTLRDCRRERKRYFTTFAQTAN